MEASPIALSSQFHGNSGVRTPEALWRCPGGPKNKESLPKGKTNRDRRKKDSEREGEWFCASVYQKTTRKTYEPMSVPRVRTPEKKCRRTRSAETTLFSIDEQEEESEQDQAAKRSSEGQVL